MYIYTVSSKPSVTSGKSPLASRQRAEIRAEKHAQEKEPVAAEYAELHCISNYTFLRGASHPEELVHQASALGYRALALTDECSMAGVVKAHVAAMECGLKLIVGSEFELDDQDIRLVLLATNRTGYGQICHLITEARRRADKGAYLLRFRDLEFGLNDCLAIWLPQPLIHRLPATLSQIKHQDARYGTHHSSLHSNSNDQYQNARAGMALRNIFGDRLWVGLELFPDGRTFEVFQEACRLSQMLSIPQVACGDVHMHHPDRKALQDVLSSIRIGQPVRVAGRLLQANREKHLRSRASLTYIYSPAVLAASVDIANRCQFSLAELRYEYPPELVPPNLSPAAYLRQLVELGAHRRYPEGVPGDIKARINKELALIAELHYEYYFLTVHDTVHFARSQDILCQGRGSAANSVVCYCLDITEVDPTRISLLFERFISRERNEPPDIDVDFEHERREEVIQYIYQKYGRHRAAIAATVITYRPKSAVRDVGKALGMDPQLVDHLARSLSWWDKREELLARFEEAGINPRSPIISQFMSLVQLILGFPRHLSQHVGGFIISKGPISQLVPIENAAMADRTIIQWDKDDIESLGLLKVDILALGMLTAIRKSLDMINDYRGAATGDELDLASIPPEDPLVYEMLQQGDSIGVFQVESRAQISMLPRLKPANFYDLVIEVAIVRPGPIQGNMVHPYLKRRAGLEQVTYANDAVKEVLERTLGVPIFQEQVIKLAVVAAGFTPGEADQLRRAMAAWKRRGGLDGFQKKLVEGMLERGHDRDFAERIFEQIKGFGAYGFPESHSASFALLVYFSAWLKRHEPAAFYCGLLNSQPMGFYSPSQLVQDARRHQVQILPVDVLYSDWESTLERPPPNASLSGAAIRLGLQRIKGVREDTALRIVHAREQRAVNSIQQLARLARLDRGDLARLTDGSALKTLSGDRHQTHWAVQGILPEPVLPGLDQAEVAERAATYLPKPSETDDLRADYQSLGLTLGRHPMAILREQYPFSRMKRSTDLPFMNHGRFVQVAGVVTGRQRPGSASGVIFLTLEDEGGNVNVVVWTRIQERFRKAVVQGRLLRIKGVVERENKVVQVVAGHVADYSHYLEQFALKSRDFH
ncbi:MAG: error-prone DNA polymerase [Gammaproteobacteria bacterium]|nr:error-prone DNA polymerase [Gammaproteobacteria bacterium]RPG25659.1 MAG: error-prone DNA polymerase [Gammaproteobacteria bacterium TMED50]